MKSAIVTDDSSFTMIGGQYKCRRGADGKYSIFDVEFFSTHAKGENGVNFAADDEWLMAAYAQMCADYPRHALPANIFHHDDEEIKTQPIRIAYIQPARTGMCYVNQKDRLTIYVNLHGVSEADFQQVCDLQLPYRSAEIASFRNHQFRALALLKDQIGYFKYAILSPGVIEGSCAAPRNMAECVDAPLVAYRSTADADNLVLLYRYGGQVKTGPEMEVRIPADVDTAKFAFEPKKKESGGEEKKSEGGGDKPSFPGGDAKKDDGAGMKNEGDESAVGGGDPKMAAIITLLTKIWKKVENLPDQPPGENEVNGDKAPSQDKGEMNDKKPKDDGNDKSKDQNKKYSASNSEKEMEVENEKKETVPDADALKKEIEADAKYAAAIDKTEKVESKLKARDLEIAAVEELASAGYRLTKGTKEKIAKYAAKGEAAVKEFVTLYKSIAEPDPPTTVEGGTVTKHDVEEANLPEEVAKYRATNPKEFSLRKSILPAFESYKRTGGEMDFDRFANAEKARVAGGGRV